MLLVDTNIISELMRPRPHPGVLQWLASTGGPLAMSVITVDEILYGLSRKPGAASLATFDALVANSMALEVSEPIARRSGQMRAALSLRGQVRSQADMLIAATAQVHALTLVTRNVRDFDGCGIALLNPFESID